MPDKKFDLGDYVEVKDRITKFYELYGNGRLVTGEVTLTSEPDGKPRVMVQALAFRSPDDPHPGVGYSWMELPGTTSYTKGSELENTETSSWGRAIASLGILNDKSIASAQEIANKQEGAGSAGTSAKGADGPPAPHDGSLVGIAETGKAGSQADFELRQSPEGPVAAFRLKQGRSGFKVIAHGALALALAAMKPEGQQVKVWGRMEEESFTPPGANAPVRFNVVHLDRMEGPDFTIPAVEADSVPAFTAEELAGVA